MAKQTYTVLYSYEDAPTLKAFALSKKRIRLIVGPFGSGKSSACVMEIYQKACEQKPDSKGVRRTRWAVVRNCYDDKTEVLTEKRGWQFFKDILETDRVATLQDGKIVYEKPEKVYVAPYKGEMIGFENELVDFLVTPDHEMWVSKRRTRRKIWGDFEVVHAGDIYGSQLYRVRKDAEWHGKDIGLSEDVFEWLGFWFAEGSFGVYGEKERCIITQLNRVEYIKTLFERAGLKYVIWRQDGNDKHFVLKDDSDLAIRVLSFVKEAGCSGERKIPLEIKNAPPNHLLAFLRGYAAGDGHRRKEGTVVLYTSSKQLADDLQEMALKTGLAANISVRNRIGKNVLINGQNGRINYLEYSVTILSEKKLRPILHVNPKMTARYRGWYKQEYDGMVYCLEMTIPTIYVRRNGKAFWCNRTYPELKDTTIKTFKDWFPPDYFGNFRLNPTPDYLLTQKLSDGTTVECEVLFRALDQEKHVRNLLSLELTGAWINEAREIPKTIFDMLDGRIDRYPSRKDGGATWAGIFMDTNPCDTEHWLYKLFVEKLPNDPELQDYYDYFHQPSGRSPQAENLIHLPPNYYQNLMVGKDPEWIRVYVDGQYGYVREGKVIYANYMDSVHCSPEPLEPWKGLPLILGWDFGLTPACVIVQHHPKGYLRVLRELCATEMGVKRFARDVVRPYLQANFGGFQYISGCDPSGARRSEVDEEVSCYLALKECGFPVRLAYSNALEARFSAVDDFLTKMIEGKPAFQLDPSCTLLRKGFNGEYKRRKLNVVGATIYAEQPEKNAVSHPHEALQYACMTIQRSVTPTTIDRFSQVSNPLPPVSVWM